MRPYVKRFWFVPLMLALLACVCTNQGIVSTPTPPLPTLAPVQVVTPFATPTALPADLTVDVDAEEALLINVYERVNPGVVNIEVRSQVQSISQWGTGSGFVYDSQGHIVTNYHVVRDAGEIWVTFYDGTIMSGEVVGSDAYGDLAVVRVDAPAGLLVPLEMGDSRALRVGQRVIAIGNPFGLQGTMTVGIISALGRVIPSEVTSSSGQFSNPQIIQTDAAINPGNSGGPLLNSQGQVIGMNTAIRTSTGANTGVGFAIPSRTMIRIVPHLISERTYHYPYLGIVYDANFTTAELAEPMGLSVNRGVVVASVEAGSAAERAGVQGGDSTIVVRGIQTAAGGDVIVAIDGQPVTSFEELIAYLVNETEVGQTVVLTVVRGTEQLDIPVVLGERP